MTPEEVFALLRFLAQQMILRDRQQARIAELEQQLAAAQATDE